MKTRKTILFLLGNEIVIEDPRDLTLNQIDTIKFFIAEETGEPFDSIEVKLLEEIIPETLSEFDVSNDGMRRWADIEMILITGVSCQYDLNSDEFLDALKTNTLDNLLILK